MAGAVVGLGVPETEHENELMGETRDRLVEEEVRAYRAADDYDEALRLVNENQYGNGTAIFTRDGGAARQFQFEVEAGMVSTRQLAEGLAHAHERGIRARPRASARHVEIEQVAEDQHDQRRNEAGIGHQDTEQHERQRHGRRRQERQQTGGGL